MRTKIRRDGAGVVSGLLQEPHRYEFFQAVRLLKRHFRAAAGKESPVGNQIRFRNSLSLRFPSSEIEALDTHHDEPEELPETPAHGRQPTLRRVELTPSFIGLTGNHGTLPRHYTELLVEREIRHRDRAARSFLDIFGNRAVALFYGAWEKYRLDIQAEHDRRNRFLPLVLALVGISSTSTRERLVDAGGRPGSVLDESLAYYSGALRPVQRSAAAVAQVVQDYFGVPIRLTQFVGQWFEIPPADRPRLGVGAATLGADAVCGERVWQRDGRLRLEIGPLRRARFEDFLPGGGASRALSRLLSMITGPALDYEVRVILAAEDVAGSRLDGNCRDQGRLGWDGWLARRPDAGDAADTVYELSPGCSYAA